MIKRSIEECLTMTITFHLKTKATPLSEPAPVTLQQLAAFRAFAELQGHLVGVYDDHDFSYLNVGFDARVCPWGWTALARIFGNREAVISVKEEAQFLGLNVRFWRSTEDAEIMMGVSSTPDGAFPINLSDTNAQLLLDAIGMANNPTGSIDADDLSEVINDPPTRRHLTWGGMETCLEQLDRMLRTCLSADPKLVWQ